MDYVDASAVHVEQYCGIWCRRSRAILHRDAWLDGSNIGQEHRCMRECFGRCRSFEAKLALAYNNADNSYIAFMRMNGVLP
jgi:hypothetical protein